MSTEQPMKLCPGARSPFSTQLFRRCTEFCNCFRWGATDMVPAMKLNLETGVRECKNMVPVERG